MTTLWIDTETFNANGGPADLGTYEYARTCEIMLVTWAVDNGPVFCWDLTEDYHAPEAFLDDWSEATTIVTHNAVFDRQVIEEYLMLDKPLRNWRCSMTQALAHSLPAGLDMLCRVLGAPTDQAKHAKRGKQLINLFCSPAPSNHKADRYTRENRPDEWKEFIDYAIADIRAMRWCVQHMPTLNYQGFELGMYHLDQKINDRGFAVDQELVAAGRDAAARESVRLAARFREITGGEVEKPTQRAKLMAFINDRWNVGIENTQGGTLDALRNETNDPDLADLCEIVIHANKTSTAKYAKLAPAVSPDGRFRGGLQFAGASRTGRWSGRMFQPHNLPSRGLPPHIETEQYIEAVKLGCEEELFTDHMLQASAALRGVLVASNG